MLIELVKVAKFPLSPWLAQIRTPFGGDRGPLVR